MDKSFIKTVKAAEKLINENSHEYFARKFLTSVNNNILKMTKYYADMQEKHPAKYNDHIVSGKMARDIEQAIACDETTALKIRIIAEFSKELEALTKEVILKNRDSNLEKEALEEAAIMIAVELARNPKTRMNLKLSIIEKTKKINKDSSFKELTSDSSIDEVLNSNYLS